MTPSPIDSKKLEARIQKIVHAQGSDSPVTVTLVSETQSVSARINLSSQRIEIQVPYDWNPLKYPDIEDFVSRVRIQDARQKIIDDTGGFHEPGHNKLKNGKGCPQDLHGKDITLDAVCRAMCELSMFSPQGALRLENYGSDIADNLNCSNYSRLDGISMFFAEQAELNNRKFSLSYEAFVKLNMHLWGTRKQKRLLSRYYTNEERVQTAVQECIQELGLNKPKHQLTEYLLDRNQWDQIFYTIAKHLTPLMDHESPEALPGTGGKGYQLPITFSPKARFDPDESDDPLLKHLLDKDSLKEIIKRRNQEGKPAPSYIESWQAKDYLYQALAGEILIKAEVPKIGRSRPIAPISARPFDPEKDNIEKLLFGKILLDEKGKPALAVPKSHIERIARYKEGKTSYPDLTVAIFDTSTSMLEAANDKGIGKTNIIPEGDNSKIHYARLTDYSIEKALHRIGVGTRMRHNLILFDKTTRSTGTHTYENRTAWIKHLLDPTYAPDTRIDLTLLRKYIHPNSVVYGITDGDVINWDEIEQDFFKIISNTTYIHFHIGQEETKMTRALSAKGYAIVRISDSSTMPKKAAIITKRIYTGQ